MRGLPRVVLAHIVDESLIHHPAGQVSALIADAIGEPRSPVTAALSRLHERGLITWEHNDISGRTFRVWLTPEGRAALGRGEHVGRVIPRRATPVSPRALPVLGPIGHLDFDPEAARARALETVA